MKLTACYSVQTLTLFKHEFAKNGAIELMVMRKSQAKAKSACCSIHPSESQSNGCRKAFLNFLFRQSERMLSVALCGSTVPEHKLAEFCRQRAINHIWCGVQAGWQDITIRHVNTSSTTFIPSCLGQGWAKRRCNSIHTHGCVLNALHTAYAVHK